MEDADLHPLFQHKMWAVGSDVVACAAAVCVRLGVFGEGKRVACSLELILSPKRTIIRFLFLARKTKQKWFSESNIGRNLCFPINVLVIFVLSTITVLPSGKHGWVP